MNSCKKRIFIFLFSLIGFTSAAIAQDTVQVKRSEGKVIIEGTFYYIHVVKAGQTLYSISRAYNLREEDIEKENPGVGSGLQIGQVLKIPVSAPAVIEVPETLKDTSDYFYHYLSEGETLFSLSVKYEVSLDVIKTENPGIDPHDLKIGQLIYIPKPAPVYQVTEYENHKVRRRETLYGISRKYDISQEELKEHNPDLYETDLKTGMILKIPKEIIPPDYAAVEEPVDTVEFKEVADSVLTDLYKVYEGLEETFTERKINIAYLIPFNYYPGSDTSEMKDSDLLNQEIVRLSEAMKTEDISEIPASIPFLEFLEGSLIALDSLRKSGVSLNVQIFDTRRSPSRLRSIIFSGELDKMDMIIGPFFSYNVELMSDFSKKMNIPLIVPFYDSKELLNNNPYLFQLNPSLMTEIEMMGRYLSRYFSHNIIIVHSKDSTEILRAEYLKNRLFESFVRFSPFSFPSFKEVVYEASEKTDIASALTESLSKEMKNLVIIPSSNEALVSIAVSQLFFHSKGYDVIMFGMPQWSVFQNVDLLYFHQLDLRFLTPYYFSYDDPAIKSFLVKWRRLYGSEPSSLTRKGCNYAFLGHDITLHFVKKFREYGPGFILHSEKHNADMLMNSFDFRKKSYDSGFENRSFTIIRYKPDLTISKEEFNIPYKVTGMKEFNNSDSP